MTTIYPTKDVFKNLMEKVVLEGGIYKRKKKKKKTQSYNLNQETNCIT